MKNIPIVWTSPSANTFSGGPESQWGLMLVKTLCVRGWLSRLIHRTLRMRGWLSRLIHRTLRVRERVALGNIVGVLRLVVQTTSFQKLCRRCGLIPGLLETFQHRSFPRGHLYLQKSCILCVRLHKIEKTYILMKT
jgi:hypothetical protein